MPNVNKRKPHRTRAQYRKDNHEDIMQKKIDYKKFNKDSINQRRREGGTVLFECGSSISKRNLSLHVKTKKHISALSAIGAAVVGADLI
jgi:hypothetical protein